MSHQVKEVRTDEIRLMKEEQALPWVRYVGRSDSFYAADNEAWWQIMRVSREGNIWTTTYAVQGSFKAKWSLRASYFPAVSTSYSAYQQNMGADFLSDTMVNGGGGISVQLAWTGNDAATGTTKIETSVDGICWCDYPDGNFTIPLTAGCKPFDIPSSAFPLFRVSYLKGTNTAGLLDIAYAPLNAAPWRKG